MSSDQLRKICLVCMERCKSGNTWPPDFAEFVALVAEHCGGILGLTVDDVLAENRRWRNDSYRYNSAESFPWSHPVMYQICLSLKKKGIDYRLTESELRDLAGKELAYWEKRVKNGHSIPPIRQQLAAPPRPMGLTPAQELYEKYKRRRAASEKDKDKK